MMPEMERWMDKLEAMQSKEKAMKNGEQINMTEACELLGIGKSGGQKKLAKHGLEPSHLGTKGTKSRVILYWKHQVMEVKDKLDAERQQSLPEVAHEPPADRIERFNLLLAKVDAIQSAMGMMDKQHRGLAEYGRMIQADTDRAARNVEAINASLVAIANTQADHARVLNSLQARITELGSYVVKAIPPTDAAVKVGDEHSEG